LDETCPDLIAARYGDTGLTVAFRTDEPPFNNREVRRALMVGTDMNAFRQLLGAQELPKHWFPNYYGNSEVYTPLEELPASSQLLYDYNPELAKQMLADAGYPDGLKTSHYISAGGEDEASLLKDQWAKIGVELEIKANEPVIAERYWYNATYEGTAGGVIEVGSPVDTLLRMSRTGAYLNVSAISDPYIDEMAVKIEAELDFTEQNRMVRELGLYILDEAFYIPRAPVIHGHYWWPWVKNYDGEVSLHDFDMAALINFMWIDQDLKAEMGY